MQLKGGQELQNGKYRIIRVLGQGGFGITYMAENILLGRFVAIKEFFPKDYCGRDNTSHLTIGTENNKETVEKLKARFLKEAQNIAKLDHPNIVKIFDVFEENNSAYYVMDLIIGENLNEIIKKTGPLSKSRALEIINKVGDALDYIHSRKMTHLDVKPANIVIREKDNQPILIDFGLSKQFNLQGEATSTMLHGISHGYSPMELYTYGSITSFTPQTDIYSLAATLFYVTSGQVPPSASEIIETGITFPVSFDSELKSIINKGMQPSRSKRPSTITGLMGNITHFSNKDDVSNEISQKEKTDIFISENTQVIDQNQQEFDNSNQKIEPKVNWNNYNTQYEDNEEDLPILERLILWFKSNSIISAIITIIIIVGVILGIFFIANNQDNEVRIARYIKTMKFPIPMFDSEIISAKTEGNNAIIFNCRYYNGIEGNRGLLDKLNIEWILPQFYNQDSEEYYIAKNSNMIFRFFDQDKEIQSITITPNNFKEYEKFTKKEKADKFLENYLSLINSYNKPYKEGGGVQLMNVSIKNIDKDPKIPYLNFEFWDRDNILKNNYGDKAPQLILDYLKDNDFLKGDLLLESIMTSLGGISYEVVVNYNDDEKFILLDSEQLKGELKDSQLILQ